MEKWKEENCKVCPRCSRVIEKLEGCDMMTCGTDTHRGEGANRQNGCGHEFLWSQAQPYKRNQAPAAIPEDGVVDGVVGAVRDFIRGTDRRGGADRRRGAAAMNATFVCESCWKDIPRGEKRFECIHCFDGFTICAECEAKLAAQKAAAEAKHAQDHAYLRALILRYLEMESQHEAATA